MKYFKSFTLLLALLFTSLAWAGEKEDLQGKLNKVLEQKGISSLALENAQVKAQNAKAADDRVKELINAVVKEIQDKGFSIQDSADGRLNVVSPDSKKPEPANK